MHVLALFVYARALNVFVLHMGGPGKGKTGIEVGSMQPSYSSVLGIHSTE